MSSLDEDPYEVVKKLEREKGLRYRVVLPRDDELQIDIDNLEALAVFQGNYTRLREYWHHRWAGGCEMTCEVVPSKTEGHFHITVRLPTEIDDQERIMLQALLGSDPVRELLSLVRIWAGLERPPTCFFEPREKLLPAAAQCSLCGELGCAHFGATMTSAKRTS